MAWIEVHQGIFRHRKTVSLGQALDIHRMSAGSHIISLWLWALDNAPTGDLSNITESVISFGAEWEGDPSLFVKTLIQVGFLDRTADSLHIHDWHDYAGRLIERRALDAERKRVQRMSLGQPQDSRKTSLATVPYRTVPFIEREYIGVLRSIPDWKARGEPYLVSLVLWAERKKIADDVLERAAIGLAKVQKKTLNGYSSLARAFQDRVNKGYDEPQGASHGTRVSESRRDSAGHSGQGQSSTPWRDALGDGAPGKVRDVPG